MKRVQIQTDADYRAAEAALTASTATRGDGEADKLEATRAVVEAVRMRGDAAVAECTARFDGVELRPDQFELSGEEIDAAVKSVEPALIAILERAHENIRRFHAQHLRESWEESFEDGTILGQRITPIERVGVYVPGGKAFYPSSVLMNIVPARVAGVSEILMVSPPSYEGSIHPVVIAAAVVAGATRIFRVGGAHAVAALAYGTETIPRVYKITGPGNAYVTLAKRLVTATCAIDSEAGPSEVVVLADDKADPARCAGELLAQSEHDEDARSFLISPSEDLVEQVAKAVEVELKTLKRKSILRAALANHGALIVTRDMDEAIRLTNEVAPEHLAIYTEYPRQILEKIRNAGAIMLGSMTPVAVGDYYGGPNHILPTSGRAKFSSPLSAEDFRKVSSIMSYSKARMMQDGDDIIRLATVESLDAHARTIAMRMDKR
jgi:histidinol dehydrogenase